MINAKDELLKVLKENNKSVDDIISIGIRIYTYDNEPKTINSVDDLDINYNNGYGSQNLYGYVLLKNNTWLERNEYDGSEWWEYTDYTQVEKDVMEYLK